MEHETKKLPFNEWVEQIIGIHGCPCIMMIAFNDMGEPSLVGAAGNQERLEDCVNMKLHKDYVG